MQALNLKPTHKLVKSSYETLGQYVQLEIDHEMAVRSAFQDLLKGCGRQFDWTLVPEYVIQKPKAGIIKVDGAMVDTFRLARGFWEAKDEHDDLEKEIRAKFDKGYPKSNIIFQAPERAVLFQNGVRQGLNEDLHDGKNLVELLKVFFAYSEPHHEDTNLRTNEFVVGLGRQRALGFWVYAAMQLLVPGKCASAVGRRSHHERNRATAHLRLRDYPRVRSRRYGQGLPGA